MGAEFNQMTLNREYTQDRVQHTYQEIRERDQYEYGHSYSGSWGSMPGGIQFTGLVFKDGDEAIEYMEKTHSKYDKAMAVQLVNGTWIIGGWASS